jgi:hypothetical protein
MATAASDTKERNFCFAYRGCPLKTALFESLYFTRAEGTYCRDDGLWYVSVSLDRSHGRRAANISNILDDYNEKISDPNEKVDPVEIPQMSASITCFKVTGPSSKNHILSRISSDSKTNPMYWVWDKKSKNRKQSSASISNPTKATGKKQQAPESPIKTGLEGLARELNLEPKSIDMQGAYMTISRNYFATHDEHLKNSGQFEGSDKEFLKDQLGRYFHKELAFVPNPFKPTANASLKKLKIGSANTIAALVATNGGTVEDFSFIREDTVTPVTEPNPYTSSSVPNNTICLYFKEMLPRWLQMTQVDSVEIAARDIVTSLNGGSGGGTYRSTCVAGFLRPFILENLIKPADNQPSAKPGRYIVDVKKMAKKLEIGV